MPIYGADLGPSCPFRITTAGDSRKDRAKISLPLNPGHFQVPVLIRPRPTAQLALGGALAEVPGKRATAGATSPECAPFPAWVAGRGPNARGAWRPSALREASRPSDVLRFWSGLETGRQPFSRPKPPRGEAVALEDGAECLLVELWKLHQGGQASEVLGTAHFISALAATA